MQLINLMNYFTLFSNREEKIIKMAARATRAKIMPCNPIPGFNPVPYYPPVDLLEKIIKSDCDAASERAEAREVLQAFIKKYHYFTPRNMDDAFDGIEVFPGKGAVIDYDDLRGKLSRPQKYFLQCVPGFGATGLCAAGDYFGFYLAIALHTLLREGIRPLNERMILGRMKYLASF